MPKIPWRPPQGLVMPPLRQGRALFPEVVGAEQTSDKCLLGGWLDEERDGFALEGRKRPFGDI